MDRLTGAPPATRTGEKKAAALPLGRGKLFYPRMAAQNIKKNARTYVPYLITCVCAVAMFYIVKALAIDPSAGETTAMFLSLGSWVMGIFAVCFLIYTNSFLMKRRKKEFGLMSVLGMERRHIARVVALETLYVYLLSMALGLGFGVLFFKLAHWVLMSLLRFDIRFALPVSWQAMGTSVALFTVIFLLLLVSSLWQVGRARPIELIRGGQVGEREPKARWIIALLGLLALGGGYWISVTVQDPIAVIFLFFVAVILVIIGTYLLFMAGGVALLKLLRRNKSYYYKANHFISVSGMMYRMKQNAAGLATICILATMVLVMISSTAALYFGMEDSLVSRYPREVIYNIFEVETDNQVATVETAVADALESQGLTAQEVVAYRAMSLFGRREGDAVTIDGLYDTAFDMVDLILLPLSDYNALTDAPASLAAGEALLLPNDKPYGGQTMTLLGQTFSVQELDTSFTRFNMSGAYNADTTPGYTMVLPDMEAVLALQAACRAQESGPSATVRYQLGFDLAVDEAAQQEAVQAVNGALEAIGETRFYSELRAANRQSFLDIYGGLFFLGLFLSVVFLMATVLIIYYKQISEGYDDQRRYDIMQKVGLSRREARRAINSQILTMFFLPLAAACVHIAFAFPALTRMLRVLNLNNVSVFLAATGVSVLVFAAFYMAIYRLTAGVYYRLVDAAPAVAAGGGD